MLLLAERFLSRVLHGLRLPEKTFAPSAQARLLAYAWPGNIRELYNVLERVALLSETSTVTAEMLDLPESTVASLSRLPRRHGPIPNTLLAAPQTTGWHITQTSRGLSFPAYHARAHRATRFSRPVPAPFGPPTRPTDPAQVPLLPRRRIVRHPMEQRRVTFLRARLLISDDSDALSETSRRSR